MVNGATTRIKCCLENVFWSSFGIRPAGFTDYSGMSLGESVISFDIETSRLPCGDALCYIWQLNVGAILVVGRTLEDFSLELDKMLQACPDDKITIWVHNLSYEFQFLAGVLSFEDDSVLIVKNRRILQAKYKNIVFKCSYMLSNMSLDKWAKALNVPVAKAVGMLDYSVVRYPDTILSLHELYYCIMDVVVLNACVIQQADMYGDSLKSMPATSTGYVRRDAKEALKSGDYCYEDCKPDIEELLLLKEAFRGGNTHANRYYTGKVIENVGSYDLSSAYPAEMLKPIFPIGRAHHVHKRGNTNMKKKLLRLINDNRCILFRVKMSNIHLKKYWEPVPYLAAAQCRRMKKPVFDNGRILMADYLEAAFTELDWDIMARQYDFDYEIIGDIVWYEKGYLPEEYLDVVKKYYNLKTALKGVDAYEYLKSKNKLNSLYGMLVQNPIAEQIVWRDNDYHIEDVSPQELLEEYSKRAVMDYQKGVWVTAGVRHRLQEAVDLIGTDVVYCDTDSVKYHGEHDLSVLNNINIYSAQDRNGNEHPIGLFEYEDDNYSEKFITWGAKKYCGQNGGDLHLAVSGVHKQKGAVELARKGGLAAFKPGFIWKQAGGVTLYYNDIPRANYCISDKNQRYKITRNVLIADSTYTLSLARDYYNLLQGLDLYAV